MDWKLKVVIINIVYGTIPCILENNRTNHVAKIHYSVYILDVSRIQIKTRTCWSALNFYISFSIIYYYFLFLWWCLFDKTCCICIFLYRWGYIVWILICKSSKTSNNKWSGTHLSWVICRHKRSSPASFSSFF